MSLVHTDLAKTLTTLRPRNREPEMTEAAFMATAWFDFARQDAKGLTLLAETARSRTHIDHKKFTPVFEVHTHRNGQHLTAFLCPDGTGLVAREEGGFLTVLPQIFKLRYWYVENHPLTLRIRSKNTPAAMVSFQVTNNDSYLPVYEADDPALREDAEKIRALDDVRADLARLAPLFETLPRIVQPWGWMPGPETPILPTRTTKPRPVEEITDPADPTVCLSWLAQRWISTDEENQVSTWGQDLADWIYDEVGRITPIDGVRILLNLGRPGATDLHPARLDISLVTKGLHFFRTDKDGLDWNALSCPVPRDRLAGLRMIAHGKRKHRAATPFMEIGMARAAPSRHRTLALRSAYGALPDLMADTLTAFEETRKH